MNAVVSRYERDVSATDFTPGLLSMPLPNASASPDLRHRDFCETETNRNPFSALEPSAALELLYEGNRRFAAGETIEPRRSHSRIREIADRQAPFAAFLGCADSRVPVEIIFDQGFGDLFVTRIAGNVATSENIGSLEFGTQVLGAKVLFVLGHTNCGAVTATMKREPVPGQISSLFQFIRPAVRATVGDVNEVVRANVRLQAQTLAEASPVLAELIGSGQLLVAGGVYDLSTGLVTPVPLD